MRTAGKAAGDLPVDHPSYPLQVAGFFRCLVARFGGAGSTDRCDLLFDTRWVRLDKLLQSEAPA